jgi:UDP-glucose 4-epimerase
MNILLTGGAGYIGSHTAVELLNSGHDVIIVDDLSNSSYEAVTRVEQLTHRKVHFYEMDLLEDAITDPIFDQHAVGAVIHFAGLKAVGESVSNPLAYYRTNIQSTLNLCESMFKAGIKHLVFSSSATVYGEPDSMPIDESFSIVDATNPYGRTKLMNEKILKDLSNANDDFNVAILRYFNPGGAHQSGKIGEDPSGIPNNLIPFVCQVTVGKRKELVVNGNDYPTPDGTCIRDYIHVVDLAKGHLAAIEKLRESPGVVTYNLGSGEGHSVLDVISAFEQTNNLKIPYSIGKRRSGDIPISFTNPALAEKELNWKTEHSLKEICRDAWNWQSNNPDGYES